MRNIIVVPFDPLWSERFRQEALRISAVFSQELISIHHIGSTAIPGMMAKPVLDIMPVVREIHRVESFNSAMVQLGYEAMGEFGIPGRRHFVKGADDDRTHHLHIYEPNHPEVTRHLNFRDYLTAHAEEARQYALLKTELARQHRNDINRYMQGKDVFIKGVLHKAQTWRENQRAADDRIASGRLPE